MKKAMVTLILAILLSGCQEQQQAPKTGKQMDGIAEHLNALYARTTTIRNDQLADPNEIPDIKRRTKELAYVIGLEIGEIQQRMDFMEDQALSKSQTDNDILGKLLETQHILGNRLDILEESQPEVVTEIPTTAYTAEPYKGGATLTLERSLEWEPDRISWKEVIPCPDNKPGCLVLHYKE